RVVAGVGVEVDGGIGPDTIAGVYAAGANRLTAGSAIYRPPGPGEAYVDLVERVRAAGATIA
ncbi:MAG: ribulose-phosphate 3-epimerase, partial [Actinomycetota bacterium]